MDRFSTRGRAWAIALALIQIACIRPSRELVHIECPYQPRGTASVDRRAASAVSDDLARAQLGGVVVQVLVGIPDSAGPVAAAVSLHAYDGASLLGANAGTTGTVRWDSLPAGDYHILARAVGFSPLRTPTEIMAGRVDTLVMRLRTDPHCLASDPPAT